MSVSSSKRLSLALALLLNAPAFVCAQSTAPAAADADYVVTASRTPQATTASTRPVQVITAQELRDAGVTSLPDLLRSLGLAETTSNGGLGQSASVFLRGANANHTVLLIDGVRVGSATTGQAALETLPLSLIERVEVLVGPASSLYGADAIGGVIQVFTKTPQRSPGVDVALTGGSQGLAQLSASYVARHGDTDVVLGFSRLHSSGFNVTTPANTWNYNADRDGSDSLNGSLKLTQHLGEHQIGLSVLSSLGETHYDDGPGIDAYARTRNQTIALNWAGPVVAGWRSELRASHSLDKSDQRTSYPDHFDTTQDQVTWLNTFQVSEHARIIGGLESLRQSVESQTAYAETKRYINGVFLGWQARYGALSVQADARSDHNTQFGEHSTGQLSVAWDMSRDWRVRLGGGTAFKAPTFNDLYYPWSGNALLKPERARNVEFGVDGVLGDVKLGATVFRSHINDLITWQAQPSDQWIPVNVGEARNQGLNLSAATTLGQATRARLNLTVQNPEDADSGNLLQRRARQFAGLAVSHKVGNVSFGTDVGYVGHRFDSTTEAASSRMGGYTLISLFSNWQITPDWALEGRVNNATDKAYTSVMGYATPGRQAQLTLRWTPAL